MLAFLLSITIHANQFGLTIQAQIQPATSTNQQGDWTVVGAKLATPFRVLGGELSMGYDADRNIARPQKLCWNSRGKLVPIADLNELRGRVRIRTGEEALAFVRLRTSPSTYFSFSPLWLEVIQIEHIPKDLCFGHKLQYDVHGSTLQFTIEDGVHTMSPGYGGFVSEELARKNQIPEAKVTRTRSGFEITRAIIEQPPYGERTQAIIVKELVRSDRRYRELGRTPFPLPANSVITWWMFI